MLLRYRQMWNRFEQWAADKSHYRRALLIIFMVALVLRMMVAVIHPFFLPDSADYSALGKAIAAGQTYEVHGQFASRMPGYPVFIAGFYYFFGVHHLPILLVQAVLGALTAIFTATLGRTISPATGLVAGALTAMDPLGIGFAASLLSEPLFTSLFILSLILLLRVMPPLSAGTLTRLENKWWPWAWARLWLWIVFAVVWAIAIYVRAEVSLCLFPLLAWSIFVAKSGTARWQSILGGGLSLLVVLLCLLPWWVRNYAIFHQDFFRFSTLQGISLYESVYSGATGGPRQSDLVIPPSIARLNESQRDLAWTHRAFADMAQHPMRVIRLAFVKVARTWSPWLHAKEYANPWVNAVLILWYGPLFVLAGIGLFRYRKKSPLFGVLLIPIVYFTCMHAVFLGSVRYRVPVMPLVMVLAAIGMSQSIMSHSDAMSSTGLGLEVKPTSLTK